MVQVTLLLCCLVDFLAHGLFSYSKERPCTETLPVLFMAAYQLSAHCSHQLISAE